MGIYDKFRKKEKTQQEQHKELFVSKKLDYGDQSAVIVDLKTHQFYNAIFSCQQRGGGFGAHYIVHKGEAISPEHVKALAKKSEDIRAKKYVEITNDNWKQLIDEK